jgi:hypothetical protein
MRQSLTMVRTLKTTCCMKSKLNSAESIARTADHVLSFQIQDNATALCNVTGTCYLRPKTNVNQKYQYAVKQ